MCHTSKMEAKIEKYVEYGMPRKIVKTVQYTLRKRAQEQLHQERTFAQTSDSEADEIFEGQSRTSERSMGENAGLSIQKAKSIDNFKSDLKIPKLCGRFKKLQQNINSRGVITNIGAMEEEPDNGEKQKVYSDVLAVGTQLTKQVAQRLSSAVAKLHTSKPYTLLTKTTQPAHVIAICILSFVLLTIWPELLASTVNADSHPKNEQSTAAGATIPPKQNTLAAIAYLGAFATHFGAQIWMTFVSGLSLYFSLPRHTFGQCQQILFPKYFALNAMLSIAMLVLYINYFLNGWSLSACVQLGALTISALIEVTVRLYLAPPLLRLMHEKYKIEGAVGSGHEVGGIVQGDLVQCPHYQRLHKAFRRTHMSVAMGNMTVMLATCLHLYYLASKIQIC